MPIPSTHESDDIKGLLLLLKQLEASKPLALFYLPHNLEQDCVSIVIPIPERSEKGKPSVGDLHLVRRNVGFDFWIAVKVGCPWTGSAIASGFTSAMSAHERQTVITAWNDWKFRAQQRIKNTDDFFFIREHLAKIGKEGQSNG